MKNTDKSTNKILWALTIGLIAMNIAYSAGKKIGKFMAKVEAKQASIEVTK